MAENTDDFRIFLETEIDVNSIKNQLNSIKKINIDVGANITNLKDIQNNF